MINRPAAVPALLGKQILIGGKCSVADDHAFTILKWNKRIELDLSPLPNIKTLTWH